MVLAAAVRLYVIKQWQQQNFQNNFFDTNKNIIVPTIRSRIFLNIKRGKIPKLSSNQFFRISYDQFFRISSNFVTQVHAVHVKQIPINHETYTSVWKHCIVVIPGLFSRQFYTKYIYTTIPPLERVISEQSLYTVLTIF